MSKRKTAVGIAVLFALALSAFAASSASALGYTAFTCAKVEPGTGDHTDAHCKTLGKGDYKHVPFAVKTDLTATNSETASNAGGEGTKASSPSILKGTISGVKTGLECSTVMGNGSMENKIESGEMYIHGTGKLTYTGCTVIEPAEKGCKVKNGKVETNELTATTQGQGMDFKFEPKSGTEFSPITIESCTIAALNNTFPVSGSLKVTEIEPRGATASTTEEEVTTQNTLKFGGQKAGLEGTLTFKGKEPTQEDSKTTALVATTE